MKTVKYSFDADGVPVEVEVKPGERLYSVKVPEPGEATRALLDALKDRLASEIQVDPSEIVDPRSAERIRSRFREKAEELVTEYVPGLDEDERRILVGFLIHGTVGLGKLEIFLKDDYLEEIAVNSSAENVYVFHREFGWLRTNVRFESESEIYNCASFIGRRVGRRITVLNPIMDAQFVTGDRVNATLFPISTKGNTITVRKFARKPWTVTEFVENGTLTPEAASFLWQAIQYEMNLVFSGGTATGKTSLLNVFAAFIPPFHRVVSIEDTREINLPGTLHWVPLTTREPNPEGKGGVTMMELMTNSLRMRPDRIIVGEIRRPEEAEVLFEAMHTGHSVYSTVHADTASQVLRRLSNPPISIPEILLESLHLIAVMHRDRRTNTRRLFEVAEVLPGSERSGPGLNTLFRWSASRKALVSSSGPVRFRDELSLHAGMDEKEAEKDRAEKVLILKAMVKEGIKTVEAVGRIMAEYYASPEAVLSAARKKKLKVLARD